MESILSLQRLNLKVLDDWLNKVQMSEVPDFEPRYPEFRVSGLPYCPILHLERVRDWHNGGATANYGMQFFTSIGTAVHDSFQYYAKRVHPKTFFGNWRCTRTLSKEIKNGVETVRRCMHNNTELNCFKDLKVSCPHKHKNCKEKWEYQEINFAWRGLSGHMDCLIKLNGKWILLDWKTTGNYLFENPDAAIKKGYYPSSKYIEQIESYAVLIKALYGIDIDYYAICYISRNKPSDTERRIKGHFNFIYKLDRRRFKRRLRILKQQTSNHRLAEKLMEKVTTQSLDLLLENKPCHSKADFKEKMKSAFFGSEVCEHSKSGKCFDSSAMRKHVKGVLKEIKEHVQ